MTRQALEERLAREMKACFPDRWDVSRLTSRREEGAILGTVKIHCSADDKTFMSDYVARLDRDGRIVELSLDGVHVKTRIACPEPR